MKLNKLIAVLAIGVIVASAMAQGGGGGGRGQGGRGGQGMMMRGMSSPAMLLLGGGGPGGQGGGLRDDVLADLKLSTEQQGKLDALREKQGERMRAMFQGNGGERPSREEMMKIFAAAQVEAEKEVNAILTPAQVTRLKQISLQVAGNRAVLQADVAKELGITAEQKAKVEDLQTKMQAANGALRQKMQDQELSREEFQEKMQANNKLMDEEIAKLLTAEQKTKLSAMAGAKFERKTG